MSDMQTIVGLITRLEEKVEKKFDKLDDRMDRLSEISAVNSSKLAELTDSVVEHVERTNLLQEDVKLTKLQLANHEAASKARSEAQETKTKEIEQSVEFMVKFPLFLARFAKWAAAISSLGALLWGAFRFIGKMLQ